MRPTYHVYVSPLGNVFMTEIAAVVAAAISDIGYNTVFPAPGLPEPGLDRVNLVVAPHEFFPLQLNHTQDELLKASESSICLGVEQPGTAWFELGSHYASLGRHTIDISTYAVEELRKRGLDVTHLQFGYHRNWDRWGGNSSWRRETDLLFLGASTERRERILSSVGLLAWEFSSDIRLFEFDRPMVSPRSHFVAGEDKWDLLAASRVLLNIHRGEVPYFEWIRVLEAVVNGALVVTELSRDYGPLVPGEHFIAAHTDSIGAQAVSILLDEPLRAEIAQEAYRFVRNELQLAQSLAPICEKLDELCHAPDFAVRGPTPVAAPTASSVPPSHPVLNAALEVERDARMRIKELLDSETDLVQTIEALQARLVHGDRNYVQAVTTPSWSGFTPEVSVVIPCYNYAKYVPEAIESVIASTDISVELIVVDDHSHDDSMSVISDRMKNLSWFPIKFLARAANRGLGAARDLGIANSRCDRVFMLDADNAIFPNCLRKLSDALDRDIEAAFSYGIISRTGQPGLLSQFPWEVDRLARANYIDAMAMIRKKIWEEVGGYDASLRGWEDYELWLRIADRGYAATFVPEFVGSYRVHGESLLQTVNLDVSALLKDFRDRYRVFPWDEP